MKNTLAQCSSTPHCHVLDPVAMAIKEDESGRGLTINCELARWLSRIGKNGSRLPQSFLRAIETSFDHNLSQVRMHYGQEVDRLAKLFHAHSFCIGNNIFLRREVLFGEQIAFFAILRHELAHIVNQFQDNKIRCWGSSEHADLTRIAVFQFTEQFNSLLNALKKRTGEPYYYEYKEFIRRIKTASNYMDRIERWYHRGDTILYFKGQVSGEGACHGEGKNYSVSNEEANRKENIKLQTKYVNEAKDRLRKIWIRKTRPIGDAYDWVDSLANALHIAQDRGSHREGIKGCGHKDDRCIGSNMMAGYVREKLQPLSDPTGASAVVVAQGAEWLRKHVDKEPDSWEKAFYWSPDEWMENHDKSVDHSGGPNWLRCNFCAYNIAKSNSIYVVNSFLKEIDKDLNLGIKF